MPYRDICYAAALLAIICLLWLAADWIAGDIRHGPRYPDPWPMEPGGRVQRLGCYGCVYYYDDDGDMVTSGDNDGTE